jgi:hypothetical protein
VARALRARFPLGLSLLDPAVLVLEVPGRAHQVREPHAEPVGYPLQSPQVGVVLAALYAGDRHEGDVGLLGELALVQLPLLPELPDRSAQASLLFHPASIARISTVLQNFFMQNSVFFFYGFV